MIARTMWTLAAETSTSTGSVALFKDAALVSEIKWDKENTHSERISLEAERLLQNQKLQPSDVDRYAVGCGPGSFTGIRVAINFIRTLAFTFEKPVVALDSLTLLAAPALAKGLEIFVMQSAFRNFVYCSRLKIGPQGVEKLLPPTALTIDELSTTLTKPTLILGRGYDLFAAQLPEAVKKNILRDPQFSDIPLASHFGFAGLLDPRPDQHLRWNATIPLYIRASEAEEKLRQSVRN